MILRMRKQQQRQQPTTMMTLSSLTTLLLSLLFVVQQHSTPSICSAFHIQPVKHHNNGHILYSSYAVPHHDSIQKNHSDLPSPTATKTTFSRIEDALLRKTTTDNAVEYNMLQQQRTDTEELASIIHEQQQKEEAQQQQQAQNTITKLTSMEELLDVMDGKKTTATTTTSKDNQFTVIKYYADYCRLCQRASIQLKKLSNEYPNVDFVKIEQATLPKPSADTLRALGVTKFPFIQIYSAEGKLVASFSTGPSHMFMKKVRDTIQLCLDRSTEEWNDFLTEFDIPIQDNINIRNQFRNDNQEQGIISLVNTDENENDLAQQ